MNNKRRNHHYNNGKNRNRNRFQQERPSINKVYDSNGPTGKQRGTASTLYEKYLGLARDAYSSSDRVLSESLMQHAEHYLRIINMIQEQLQMSCQQPRDINEQPNSSEFEEGSEVTDRNEAKITEMNSIDSNGNEATETNRNTSEASSVSNSPKRRMYPYGRRKVSSETTDVAQQETKTLSPQTSLTIDTSINTLISENKSLEASESSTLEAENTVKRRSVKKRTVATRGKKKEDSDSKDNSKSELS